jgi:hypothetical protein
MEKIKLMMILFWIIILCNSEIAQERGEQQQNQKKEVLDDVFSEIERALSTGNIAVVSRYFSSQTYFSLTNGVNGYYSANQAYYLLEDFFKQYQVTSFRYNTVKTDANVPYATGIYQYEFRGRRNSAQIYISLKFSGNHWKISQITFN